MPVHPEAYLISAVVRTGEYQTMTSAGITPSLFHAFPDEADWMFRYITTHHQAPERADIKHQFPEFTIYKGSDNVQHWCDEVKKSHKQAAIIEVASEAMELVDQDDPDAALELLARSAVQINSSVAGVGDSTDILSDWGGVYEDVKYRKVRAELNHGIAGVPTGFPTLDEITGGLQPGWLTIIGARLGQGKTFTGIKMGFTAAMAGKRVLFFSLEQPKNQIAMRVHAFGAQKYAANPINPMNLARGKGVDLIAYKRFLEKMESEHGSGEFRVNDASRGRVTPQSIAAAIEVEQPELVIIDYLTLLASATDDWRGSAKLSGDIQAIAHDFKVPVIALAQINRTGVGGKEPPGVESLYSSDAIGHDADLVITQMRRSDSVMMHKVRKFRHGPDSGQWYSEFSPQEGVFEEISPEDANDLMDQDALGEED